MSRWLRTFFFRNVKKWKWGICGSNKTAPWLTRYERQWLSCKNTSTNVSSLWWVILGGQHALHIEHTAFSFSGNVLKCFVYANRPKTLSELKNNIPTAIAKTDAYMLDKMNQNFRVRLSQGIDQSRAHLRNIIHNRCLKNTLNVPLFTL